MLFTSVRLLQFEAQDAIILTYHTSLIHRAAIGVIIYDNQMITPFAKRKFASAFDCDGILICKFFFY